MEQNNNINSESLSRIKEILFSDEFQSIETRLNEIKSGFNEKISENEKKLLLQIELLKKEGKESRKEAERLFEKQKEEFERLTENFDKKIKELKTDIETLQKETTEKLKDFLTKSNQNSKEEIDKIKKSIEKTLEELRSTKVDKAEIAELFGMVINKLK
jgi:cell division protein ZapA (FtsZ GTPase activity inhibitor)